ncbi:hypothetical protein EYF80_054750 [Liparis tanakae]|uniref:Uncharacterized protein n=1 Tax=Liparis tanakae TaxID=230148 RepID=A0A4Z2F1K9_9TELE|nr:hypothetical protein EYF80_054750 [Liparis tanakae]
MLGLLHILLTRSDSALRHLDVSTPSCRRGSEPEAEFVKHGSITAAEKTASRWEEVEKQSFRVKGLERYCTQDVLTSITRSRTDVKENSQDRRVPTGYSDLVVVQDGQSFHSFSFTVELQQTGQRLSAGCWEEEEGEEEEEKGEERKRHFQPLRKSLPTFSPCPPHLVQLVLAQGGRGVIEVQDGGGRLDDVPRARRAAEAIVPAQAEVLVAAAAVRQLEHLAGDHRLLLGHTGRRQKRLKTQPQFILAGWRPLAMATALEAVWPGKEG